VGSWAIPKVTVSLRSLLGLDTALTWVLVFPTVAGTVVTLLAEVEVATTGLGWSVTVSTVLDSAFFPSCDCFCSESAGRGSDLLACGGPWV
jgi:hypothetical protein